MSWLEQKIRHYEHARWATDSNRSVFPFQWGLESLGGRADEPNPRAFLNAWVEHTLARSDAWFAVAPAADYRLHPPENSGHSGRVVTFTSAVESPWPENNLVHARLFAVSASGPAVVVLPQWNAKWDVQVNICRWLNRMGITALRLSMPYHDRRMIPGHQRADYLVGPNIGLTIQANRQAVMDTRRCLLWLARQGYSKLGLVGTSIGSAIGFITMAHDPLVRAGAQTFPDVRGVHPGTHHVGKIRRDVQERAGVSADELRRYWSPISPFPYVPRMRGAAQKMLMVVGRHDPTFLPEFSESIIREVRCAGVEADTLVMPCGHYSLELKPFSYPAALKMGTFLFQHLA